MTIINVTIIDDDPDYRKLLSFLLSKNKLVNIVGEYEFGAEFIRDFDNKHYSDVYLIDVVLPDMSGIKVAEYIKKTNPEAHIIIMTASPDKNSFNDALKINADYIQKGPRIGYLLNELIQSKVTTSNEKIISLNSNSTLSPKHLEMAWALSSAKQRMSELSHIQFTVLKLKVKGKSSDEISEILDMKPGTVRTHIARAIKKLDLPDVMEYFLDGDK